MLRTYSRLREEQFFFHYFYFPKSRKSELDWNQNACKLLFFPHIPIVYGQQYIILHCTCTIHLCENYNHCLVLSIRNLKIIRFLLMKFKNISKSISRLKLPRKQERSMLKYKKRMLLSKKVYVDYEAHATHIPESWHHFA